MAKKNLVTTNDVANYLQSNKLSLPQLAEYLKHFRNDDVADRLDVSTDIAKQHYDTLIKSLQAAVTLEFATIPAYLCALWSIKDDLDPIAKSIRQIVQEEMLHMALVSNLLASMGEVSNINTNIPSYPGPLPGGVHDGLIVHLSGLNKAALRDFLWIERPVQEAPINHPYSETDRPTDNKSLGFSNDCQNSTTIGEFYDEILKAFEHLKPKMTPDNQISGPLAWTIAQEIKDVKFIIKTIQDQGEGSGIDIKDVKYSKDGSYKISHYYRFLEVFLEEKFKWNNKTKEFDVIGKMPFPEVWPVARVPKGGYKREDVSDEVWYYLNGFDTVYTILVNQLAMAWTSGGQDFLIHAYDTMFALEKFAKPLMKIRTPYGGGDTYAPNFRYKPDQDKLMRVGEVD